MKLSYKQGKMESQAVIGLSLYMSTDLGHVSLYRKTFAGAP